MKFTDGNWLIRKGFKLISPIQVFALETATNRIKIYASPKDLSERSTQLDLSLLTVCFSSPREDIIRVQIYRHKGQEKKHPHFQIQTQTDHHVETGADENEAYLRSGKLTVKIRKNPWNIDFYYNGKRITGSGLKCMAHITTDKGKTYIREQLDLGVGEYIYGLGERFTPFVKNGQNVEIWNEDGGTSTEQAYKNVPFYLSNRSYGVFVNHPENVSFEIASEKVSKVQFSVEGEYLEYNLIGGKTVKHVLKNYTSLTGKPSLPPAWSFGLWFTTSFTTNYDEKTVLSFVNGMKQRDIPLHIFHFDCFWMKALHWMDFQWNPDIFPDPEGMLRRLKEKGLKICVWINPYIAQQSPLFDEAVKNGFLLKKTNGDVWQWDRWQPGMGIVDFTHPQACRWFADYLRRLIDMGVDCFKTDFGERIPTDVVYYDGSDPVKMHNYYSYLYNKIVYEVLEEKQGRGQAVVFARSATAGSQKFPVHWGGDCFASYESMAESLRGGLSLGLSGFGFWSHDIGGFESTSSADLYKRWAAFGLLSSHSRLHGNQSYRVPWLYDEEAVSVVRFFVKWKCRLMPYLFAAACDAAHTGIPMMRAMLLEFPDDPTCAFLDRQYMLGNSLLVAPIFSETGEVTFYLPEGLWTHFFTNEKVNGGKWQMETHNYMSLPLYVRPNSIIPIGREDRLTDYDYANGVEFHLFALEDGKKAKSTIYDLQGRETFHVEIERICDQIIIQTNKISKPWSIVLRDMEVHDSSSEISINQTPLGTRIVPKSKTQLITLQVSI